MFENRNLIQPKKDPFLLFEEWFEEAKLKEQNDPNAMNLSTISKDLKPSSRIVLLKSFDQDGFVFYTNLQSKKGISLLSNSNASLTFHWKSLLKQIRIEGRAYQVTSKEADDYFNGRPMESRISAWASNQSSELSDRQELIDKFSLYKKKFQQNSIQRPPHWMGFRVEPNLIEFWKDMPFRLHDRIEYKKIDNKWISRRLYP
jgi:pyridoxamine 5'-phosphate oxidase